MRWERVAPALLAISLAGCGSSGPPPVAIGCALKTLPGGFVQARIKITNSTPEAHDTFLYGPALGWVRHEVPVLKSRPVLLINGGKRISYVGFVVPTVKGGSTTQVTLRFKTPPSSLPLAVSFTHTVKAKGESPLQSSGCHISR